MKCKYCHRETKYTDVCNICSCIEKDLLKYGEPVGTLHDGKISNSYGLRQVEKDYQGRITL